MPCGPTSSAATHQASCPAKRAARQASHGLGLRVTDRRERAEVTSPARAACPLAVAAHLSNGVHRRDLDRRHVQQALRPHPHTPQPRSPARCHVAAASTRSAPGLSARAASKHARPRSPAALIRGCVSQVLRPRGAGTCSLSLGLNWSLPR